MFKPFEAFEVITAILKPLSLIIENIWAHSSHSPDQVKELSCTILKSVDETLLCDHSNESYSAILSCGIVHYAVQGGSNLYVCG